MKMVDEVLNETGTIPMENADEKLVQELLRVKIQPAKKSVSTGLQGCDRIKICSSISKKGQGRELKI